MVGSTRKSKRRIRRLTFGTYFLTREHTQKPKRYTDEDQCALFPGDRGFEYVAGLQDLNLPFTTSRKQARNMGMYNFDAERTDKYNPQHYRTAEEFFGPDGLPFQVIHVIELFSLDFPLGNAIKYILRSKAGKPGEPTVDELEKAIWYLKRKQENIKTVEQKAKEADKRCPKQEWFRVNQGIEESSLTQAKDVSSKVHLTSGRSNRKSGRKNKLRRPPTMRNGKASRKSSKGSRRQSNSIGSTAISKRKRS